MKKLNIFGKEIAEALRLALTSRAPESTFAPHIAAASEPAPAPDAVPTASDAFATNELPPQ